MVAILFARFFLCPMGRLSEYVNGYRGSRPVYLSNATKSAAGVHVEIDEQSFRRSMEAMARLLVEHPDTRKLIKKYLSKEASKIRRNITKDVRNNMENDPRKAYLAVKRALYRRALGFNVSILNRPKGSAKYKCLYRPYRKLDENPNQWGGNRRTRSEDTERANSYYGPDRAYILRFYNSGTVSRDTRFGNRGAMPGRRVFATSATFQIQGATDEISKVIEEIMAEEFNK